MAEGHKFYHVTLTAGERSELQRMLSSGRHAARKLTHARVLLMSDSSPGDGRKAWTAQLLSDELVVLGCVDSISKSTVRRVLKETSLSRGRKKCG